MGRHEPEPEKKGPENSRRIITDAFSQVGRIHEMNVAVNGVDRLGLEKTGDGLNHVGGSKEIVGVEDTYNIAGGCSDAFVHGVVQPPVRLGNDTGDSLFVGFENGQRLIGAPAVYYDVFDVGVGLGYNAPYRIPDSGPAVISRGNNGYFHG